MTVQYVEIGSIFQMSSGGTPSKKNPEYYLNGDIPWVKTGDLKTMYLANVDDYITKLGVEKSSAKVFPKGTVLIAMYGATIGNCSILNFEAATNQACAAFLPNEKVLPEFLYFYLASIKEKLVSLGVGGAQPNISQSILKSIKIPLITLEKQMKVIEVLSEGTTLINKRQSQIKALDELTQSLFLEMFGDPKTNDKNWDVCKFGDVVINHNHLRVPLKDADRKKIHGTYPYYGATGIVDYINQFKFSGEYLLISEDGKALESRNKPIAFIANGDFWVNNHAHVVTATEKTNIRYLERYLETIDISNFITGIDQYKLNKNNLNKIPVNCPPVGMQNEFALKVIAIQEKKQIFEKSLEKYNELYNSLIQKAFKGELFQD